MILIYEALLTQTDDNNPTVEIFQNSLGNIDWTRNGAGDYVVAMTSDIPIGVDNPTALPISSGDLDTAYPDALTGFRVYCKNILLVYEKSADGYWFSQSITIVV